MSLTFLRSTTKLLSVLALTATVSCLVACAEPNQPGAGPEPAPPSSSAGKQRKTVPQAELAKQKGLATFGGGCFWCVEAVFEDMDGVAGAVSGYAGGKFKRPTYDAVCSGRTGHAEVCQIHYDPEKVSFKELLAVFFKTHDPTTLNRQGNDTGTQYRSVIMYHSDQQKEEATAYIKKLEAAGSQKIVTQIVPSPKFYVAEDYHQNYFANNPSAGYCLAIVGPKVKKFREAFPEKQKQP